MGAVRAWDLPTRLFHWSLVSLILTAYITAEYAEALGDNLLFWHRCNGLCIIILLVFRLLWGIFGAPTARFNKFLKWPWHAFSYAVALVRGRSPFFLGHNPLGAWMVVALLAIVMIQALLGLFASDDTGTAAGPLYRLVTSETVQLATKWHHRLFKRVLLPLIGLHILVNLVYVFWKKEPLIQAMVTGTKPQKTYVDAGESPGNNNRLAAAALCLLFATAIVLLSIWGLSGRIV